MTFFTILAIGVLLGLLLAWPAVRALFHTRRPTLSDLETLLTSSGEHYVHLDRVLASQDFEFLASTRRGQMLVSKLRGSRRRILRLYLGQMRREFDSLMAIGLLFANAPTARAESFARQLARHRFRFYRMLLRARLRLIATYFGRWGGEVAPLGDEIQTVRRQAERIMNVLTPEDLGALRKVLQLPSPSS